MGHPHAPAPSLLYPASDILELDGLIEAWTQWWPAASDGKMVAVLEFPWHILFF